jgi:hypothetical protein
MEKPPSGQHGSKPRHMPILCDEIFITSVFSNYVLSKHNAFKILVCTYYQRMNGPELIRCFARVDFTGSRVEEIENGYASWFFGSPIDGI